jgi:hypothetical protein
VGQVEFTAIRYPTVWPPPELPMFPPHPLSWIPVIGRLFQYFRWVRSSHEHQKAVLDPIAEEIISQLATRPSDGSWPTIPEQRSLAQVISDAVCLEKGLANPPALHPDDPFPLLFWGPFDDITPLIVRMGCRDKLKREIPGSLIIDAWNGRWTIERFIQQVLETSSTLAHSAG